jgi:hypothetical protein
MVGLIKTDFTGLAGLTSRTSWNRAAAFGWAVNALKVGRVEAIDTEIAIYT